jgi:hypothetical protein
MSNRLDQERKARLEPARIKSCSEKLESLGYQVTQNHVALEFIFKGNKITFYPYSGWYSGKGIGSDRGFNKLLKKLEDKE